MSSKLLKHRAALCNIVRRIAVEAGELTLEYFDGLHDHQVFEKKDGSPVTEADNAAEVLIAKRLGEAIPDVLVIGEESFTQSDQQVDFSAHDYFWLVDPIDGTKAFIRGESDFTVNIGLIYKGEPVLGVIYAPEKGELYSGYIEEPVENAKALRYFEDSETEREMYTREMPPRGLVVMSSAYSSKAKPYEKMLDGLKIDKIVRRASSLKICAIANGKADLYPRFGPTCEWDTAAGHAILRAAGGDICDLDGKPLRYGRGDPGLLNPNFIAASGDLLAHLEFPVE